MYLYFSRVIKHITPPVGQWAKLKSKQYNTNFSKIWLLVPSIFLKQFDEEIKKTYPSRNEAIRRGMKLVLEELRQLKTQKHEPTLSSQLVEPTAIQSVNERRDNRAKHC